MPASLECRRGEFLLPATQANIPVATSYRLGARHVVCHELALGLQAPPIHYEPRMSARTFVILVVVAGAALRADAQSLDVKKQTLVDLAREHGSITRSSSGCGWVNGPPTLESLLKKADVVVHGTVVSAVGKLSDDQHEVWTDYAVQPITIVYDGTADLRVVGSSDPPVFTTLGGTVFVEGLRIAHTVDSNGSSVRLDLGDEVVLLGKSRNGRFDLDPFGVFSVQAGRVSPNGRWPQLSAGGGAVDLDTFLSRVGVITSH
jgi:hypothetical protein